MRYKYLIFLFLIFFMRDVVACSCNEQLDIESMDKNSEIVFVGSLQSTIRFYSFTKNKLKFGDLKIYKGKALSEIGIWTDKSSASCGASFQSGVRYVIFAYRDENKLWTGRCSSWPINDKYQEYTDSLNKFYDLEVEGVEN